MKVIELIVAPNGETKLETKGFSGSQCQDASRYLERALGRLADEKMTAEFFQAQEVRQDQQQRS